MQCVNGGNAATHAGWANASRLPITKLGSSNFLCVQTIGNHQ